MAATLAFFSPSTTIRASSSKRPDPNHKKSVSPNWWAPLFGWSSDPDYITNAPNPLSFPQNQPKMPDLELDGARLNPPRPRFTPGCFTEEKAKQLRKKTAESSSFHDIMYHSSIASRLASDVSGGPEI